MKFAKQTMPSNKKNSSKKSKKDTAEVNLNSDSDHSNPQSVDDDDDSVSSVHEDNSGRAIRLAGYAPAQNVGRKRIIDETQLDPEEARKLESRRAYNRQCAAKARKRSKDLVAHLQGQVDELKKEKAEYKRSNEVMKAQLEMMEQQNRTLMMNQMATSPQHSSIMFGGFAGLGGLSGTAASQLMGMPGAHGTSPGLDSRQVGLGAFGADASRATALGSLADIGADSMSVASMGRFGMQGGAGAGAGGGTFAGAESITSGLATNDYQNMALLERISLERASVQSRLQLLQQQAQNSARLHNSFQRPSYHDGKSEDYSENDSHDDVR